MDTPFELQGTFKYFRITATFSKCIEEWQQVCHGTVSNDRDHPTSVGKLAGGLLEILHGDTQRVSLNAQFMEPFHLVLHRVDKRARRYCVLSAQACRRENIPW